MVRMSATPRFVTSSPLSALHPVAEVRAFCSSPQSCFPLHPGRAGSDLHRKPCRAILLLRPAHSPPFPRSDEHTSELQSRGHLVCRPPLEKKPPQPSRQTDRCSIRRT